MTQPQNTENFFILLDIDPSQPWSDDVFKKTLQAKRGEWTRISSNPRLAPQYKRYLDLVPQINLVMLSEESRKAEAAEDISIAAEGEKEAKEELERQLRLTAAKGYILKEETDKLVEQFKGQLLEERVRDEVRKINATQEIGHSDGR